jgi:hypothetical protein
MAPIGQLQEQQGDDVLHDLYARGFNQDNKVMLLAYDGSHEALILRMRWACWGSKEQKLRYSGDRNRE